MTILVTGGAGFIGSHLVDTLVEKGYEVVVVDNLSGGSLKFVNDGATFYQEDICNLDGLSQIFEKHHPKYVFHLAAQTNAMLSNSLPVEDCQENILGTVNLLELSRKFGVKKIVYSSTAAVYGEPLTDGIDENHINAPQCFYGVSKLSAEKYFQVFYDLFQLDYTILRYSNVFGPRQTAKGEGGVVAVFLEHLFNDKTPTIYGDGTQTRDFVYVSDVVEANLAALLADYRGIINISTGIECSVIGLYEKMSKLLSKSISPIFKEKKKGDIYRSYLLNSKAKATINWAPVYKLDIGLEELVRIRELGQW